MSLFAGILMTRSGSPTLVEAAAEEPFTETDDAPVTAQIVFKTTGQLIGSGAPATMSWWSKGHTAVGAAYEVRATLTAGGFTAEAAADTVWIAINADRTWSVTETSPDPASETATATFEIRDVATQTVQASASLKVLALPTPP